MSSTLAGVLLTALLQQRSQRADRATAATEARRRDALDAVSELATVLADHRRVMWRREDLRLTGADWTEARTTSHATRAAITAPSVRVTVLLPELAAAVDAAARTVYSMRNAADHTALEVARDQALAAANQLVTDAGRLLAA
ncbi:protein kilB [Streptomyces sp. NPDC047515]|uniref:protein kilB n=1 Tax=Streptomyces sp. NPDC047515 TaxID=3155380 RepID=UPI003402B5A9